MPKRSIAFPTALDAWIATEAAKNLRTYSAQVVFLVSEIAGLEEDATSIPQHPRASRSIRKHPRDAKSIQQHPLASLWEREVPWAPITQGNIDALLELADGDAATVDKAIRLTAERIPVERRRNSFGYCRKILENWKTEREAKKAEANPPGLKPDLTPEQLAEKKAYAAQLAQELGWGE